MILPSTLKEKPLGAMGHILLEKKITELKLSNCKIWIFHCSDEGDN